MGLPTVSSLHPDRPRHAWLSAAISVAALLGMRPTTVAADEDRGVVVEQVDSSNFSGERVGLRPGDVIVAWSREATAGNPAPAGGRIESPLDLYDVDMEQGPRGRVTLQGFRGGVERTWTLPPAPFGLHVRPPLGPARLAQFQEAMAATRAGRSAEADERWRAAAAEAVQAGPAEVVWLWSTAAKAFANARAWDHADQAYAAAVREVEKTDRWISTATLLWAWGYMLGTSGEVPRAEEHLRRALEILQRHGPESMVCARILMAMGIVAWDRGDLDAQERYSRSALAIYERQAPHSYVITAVLSNLAMAAENRGDLATAEALARRSLTIHEQLLPGSEASATILQNLGNLATRRGDLSLAEVYQRRSLAIRERLAKDSVEFATTLGNLGEIARRRGDLAAAEDYFRRGVALHERLVPGTQYVAESLTALGEVIAQRGDLAAAERHQREALAIFERASPGGLGAARALSALAAVLQQRGDLSGASDLSRQALAIRQRLAPGSAEEAESLHALGRLEHEQGRVASAARLFLHALDTLEAQETRLGGTQEAQSSFVAKFASFYQDALEVHLELGENAQALHVLERARARIFLEMLAERDLTFASEIPEALLQEQRRTDAQYDRAEAALAMRGAPDAAAIEAAQARLRELRVAQDDVARRIREASPRVASLRHPQPLDLAGVRAALDPGTVLLAYAAGQEKTILFVVRSAVEPDPGLSVFSLPIGEKALRAKVEAFRRAIEQPRSGSVAALRAQAKELYDLLVRPADTEVAGSERLLLSPDGPLLALPFAALLRRHGTATSYLVEWRPLHVVASATVYAELKKSRRQFPPSGGRLVAFGDPRYPSLTKRRSSPVADAAVRSMLTRGATLAPLPATREEVERIARLFPGEAETHLGADATEERAKSLDRETRYVHFACHGFLDERSPLDSGLALTIPRRPAEGQDNGLLQAWEIFDRVRIDADLVTLSGCRTGLGREMGGEGLVGLTRAFQYAGARSVLATLWAVPDKSTSRLMTTFYRYLKAGQSADQALRSAQVDLIAGRGSRAAFSHPFRWAAFQLSGDWR